MATFTYTAKSRSMECVAGTIEADSKISAACRLRTKGLYAVDIESQRTRGKKLSILDRLGLSRVGRAAVLQFTEQFANLLEAAVPLERSLSLLEHQQKNTLMKTAICGIKESVCTGKTLTEAMSQYPKIFPSGYVSMVRVGEEAGLLADMLKRLTKALDEEYQLRTSIRAAMVYPVFLMIVGLGTVIVLMLWVIPKFSSFFNSLEQKLPWATRIVIEISSGLAKIWPIIIVTVVLLIIIVLRLLRNETVRFLFDKFSLRIPVVRGFIIKYQLARLMRTLGVLLLHGVNMLSALTIAGDTLSNRFIREHVRSAHKKLAGGKKLHECFSQTRVFSETVLGVMAMGQESGSLPEMMIRIADQYEQQTERQIKALTGLIEPVMILFMGGIVGFVVVSMLMPIFKVSSFVH